MHKVLYELQDLITDEIAEVVNRKTLNAETLCNLDKAVDIYKDIQVIENMDAGGNAYETGRNYMDEWGYAEGGRSYSDGMRRNRPMSRARNTGTSRGYYDNDDKQRMREHYERELRRATSEQERENIRRMMRELDQDM